MKKGIAACIVLGVLGLVVLAAEGITPLGHETMTQILAHYLKTGAQNAVTAVYLDFRIFDTLLEAFLLLVSVVGISQFLRLEDIEKVHFDVIGKSADVSPLTASMERVLLFFAIGFGIYVIAFGANSPGGGFQGGAVLATVVMIWYLTQKRSNINFPMLSAVEETCFLLFLGLVGTYFLLYPQMGRLRGVYLLLCAILVGGKVAVGLSVIFLRFMGDDEARTKGGHYE